MILKMIFNLHQYLFFLKIIQKLLFILNYLKAL